MLYVDNPGAAPANTMKQLVGSDIYPASILLKSGMLSAQKRSNIDLSEMLAGKTSLYSTTIRVYLFQLNGKIQFTLFTTQPAYLHTYHR